MPLKNTIQSINKFIIGKSENIDIRIFNIVSFYIFFTLFLSIFGTLILKLNIHLFFLSISGTIIYGFLFFYLRDKEKNRLILWVYSFCGQILFTLSWFFNDGILSVTIYYYILFFAMNCIILNSWDRLYSLIIFSIIVLYFQFIESVHPGTYTVFKYPIYDNIASIILITLFIYLIINIFKRNYLKEYFKTYDALNQISKQSDIISEQNIEQQKLLEKLKQNEKILKHHQENLSVINRILRHDIINNLSVIHSVVNLYRNKPDPIYLEEIIRNVKRSKDIIQVMKELEINILMNKEFFPFSLLEIFAKLKEQFPTLIIIPNDDVRILIDKSVFSVFDNLIKNALIHSKTDRIEIKYAVDNDKCIVRVIDYGKGIPDNIKLKVFNEGFSHGDSGNTGLGLYIVKKSMEHLGGSIVIEDTIPHGTTFVLSFKREI